MFEQDTSTAHEPWIELVLVLLAPLAIIFAPLLILDALFGGGRKSERGDVL